MRTVGSAENTLALSPLEPVELCIRSLWNILTRLRRLVTNAKIAVVDSADQALAALNLNDLTRRR